VRQNLVSTLYLDQELGVGKDLDYLSLYLYDVSLGHLASPHFYPCVRWSITDRLLKV
jgi:hypothetical protein